MTALPGWTTRSANFVWGLIFRYPSEKKTARWIWVLLGILFLTGVFWWGTFYHWGRYPMDYQDWLTVSAPRFYFLRNSMIQLTLPLHAVDKAVLGGAHTPRYMSVPDAFLSPQLVLLRGLSIERFVFLDMVGMYSLGFLGLLWLRRRFALSIAAFSLLFFLFNFNGHILAHLSIGHETWGGYFLFSWFVVLMMDLLDGDRSWGWVTKVALLLFIMLLQGSYHQYVWALFFLAFLSIAQKRAFFPAVKAAVATILLSAVRLLPVALGAGDYDQTYHGGYLGIVDFLQSMIMPRIPNQQITSPSYLKPLGGWEVTLYIGAAGLVFLAFFGVYRWISDRGEKTYHALLLPTAGLILLSLNSVFFLLRKIPFPMFSGERVATRILSLPFIFLVVMASIEFQRWLDRRSAPGWLRPAVWAALTGPTIWSLWNNLETWSILKTQPLFKQGIMIYNKWVVARDPHDTIYYLMLEIGAGISILVLVLLLELVLLERRRAGRSLFGAQAKPQPPGD